MSWTVLVKSPVIPQWADFSVTAPSGLVPWPAFYDGSETVTVIWWITPSPSLPYYLMNESYITSNLDFWTVHIWLWSTTATYLWNPIWFIIQPSVAKLDVIKGDLSNNTVSLVWGWTIPWWSSFNSAYLDWTRVYINMNWPSRYEYYDLATDTLSWSIVWWTYTTWTLLTQSTNIWWLNYAWGESKEVNDNEWIIYFKIT